MAGLFGDGGGGGGRAPKKSDGGIGGWISRGVHDIAGLTHLGELAKGAARQVTNLPRTRFDRQAGLYLSGSPAAGQPTYREQALKAARQGPKGFLGWSAEARNIEAGGTVLGLLPGIQTYAGGWHGFHEHPVLTVLDVLPYAGKLAAFARAADFAEVGRSARAAARAEGVGEAAAAKAGQAAMDKALRAPLRTIGKTATADIQKSLEASHPAIARLTPNRLLEHVHAGGQVRDFMQHLGPVGKLQRNLSRETNRWIEQVDKLAAEAKLSPERATEITHLLREGAPGWEAALLHDGERAFVHAYRDLEKDFAHKGIEAGLLVERNGNLYTKAEHARIMRTVAKAEALQREAEQLKQALGASAPTSQARGVATRRIALKERQAARLQTAANNVVPGVWKQHPQILDAISRRLQTTGLVDHPIQGQAAWEQIIGDLTARGLGPKLTRIAARETRAMWQSLKAEGFEPGFVHQVGESEVERLTSPKLTPFRVTTPSEVKTKAYLPGRPWRQDLRIALTGQGVEWLQREKAQAAVQTMIDKRFVRPRAELEAEPRYIIEAQKTGKTIKALIERDYQQFNPESVSPLLARRTFPGPGAMMIPRTLASTLDVLRAADPAWKKAASLPTRVFTFSVLRIRPGYYLHIALASATILFAKESPTALRYFGQAIRDLHGGAISDDLATHLGDAVLPGSVGHTTAMLNFAAGRTLGRLLHQAGKLENVTGWIHDISEQMTYLYEKNKAVAAGFTPKMAHDAAVEAANGLFQRWDRMTPLERNVVRMLMPFYGWSKFLMQTVISYPFDHPIRASIMAHYAQNELDDWPTGLPERLMSYFIFGHPDAQGRRLAIPSTGAIPFQSVPNLFSMAGLYSHLHPIIHAVLESRGLSNFGETDLYPQMDHVDQTTGMIVLKHPSILRTVPESLIGQTQAVEALLGLSQDLRSLRATNPEAWKRLVYNQLGLQMIPTRISLEEEAQKMAKRESQVERSLAHQAAREATTGGGGSKTGLFGG